MTHYSSIKATEIRTGTMLLCFRVHKLWNIVRSLINSSGNWIVMRNKIHERMLPHHTVYVAVMNVKCGFYRVQMHNTEQSHIQCETVFVYS